MASVPTGAFFGTSLLFAFKHIKGVLFAVMQQRAAGRRAAFSWPARSAITCPLEVLAVFEHRTSSRIQMDGFGYWITSSGLVGRLGESSGRALSRH
jgi:hypothetical protein